MLKQLDRLTCFLLVIWLTFTKHYSKRDELTTKFQQLQFACENLRGRKDTKTM